ncbi:uncharacterized protein LOC111613611 [Centruroides sculpturatus]|uniref:uncharacterized protein LOC111613611 n=1 Tax=Centruroides sculpturatus TaxID=218467 RepID=UPI000C6D2B83|nr:uncharacterized protein LOC111613611 [Centruroides sculpturatus]
MGCNHAGTWAAKTLLRKKDPADEVLIFDRNDNISFLGCGIALWVAGLVENPATLFYSSLEELEKMGARVLMRHEISAINAVQKTVELYQHAQSIIAKAADPSVQAVAVIGAGYIGVELAEAFDKHGKKVYLIEMQDAIAPHNFDREISAKLVEGVEQNTNIDLRLGEKVIRFTGDEQGHIRAVETDQATYQVDMAIVSVGFRARIEPARDQIETDPQRGIIVDEFFQTSDPDIYAIGDCVAQKYNPDACFKPVMLATNAVRSGIVAALNVLKPLEDYDKPVFMPRREKVFFKVVFDRDTREIIGAQIASKADHASVMYMLSLAIEKKVKIDELGLIDTYFLPHLNQPVNFITRASLQYLDVVD